MIGKPIKAVIEKNIALQSANTQCLNSDSVLTINAHFLTNHLLSCTVPIPT